MDKMIQELLEACALGAGFEDAAATIKAEIATVNGNTVTTKSGAVWRIAVTR